MSITDGNKLLREFWALALCFLSVFCLLSLVTYSPLDPGFNQHVSQGYAVKNQAGIIGAYLAGLLVDLFGVGSYAFAAAGLWAGLSCFFQWLRPRWWRWAGFGLGLLCLISFASHPWAREHLAVGEISGGGFSGTLLFSTANRFLRFKGALLVWSFLVLLALQLSLGLSWNSLGKRLKSRLRDGWYKHKERADRKRRTRRKKTIQKQSAAKSAPAPNRKAAKPSPAKGRPSEPRSTAAEQAKTRDYPGVDLLTPVAEDRAKASPSLLEEQSRRLRSCLGDFGVQGEVERVQPGPVVTMFEVKPAPGVKISRIAGLSDDLALALKALAVRIEAPIPGKDTVGIEIPNEQRQTVYLREIIASDNFSAVKARLPLALGKDIQGQPRVEDLARMPHLLVAGATGAGKSVCLNAIILSLLFKSGPEELKLLVIDPKRIEMAAYADLPHLVHPVVTEVGVAKAALDWAVHEMEQRYQALAQLGVRHIDAYNKKLAGFGDKRPEGLEELAPLPYLVLIIDELADLMLTAAKEVEVNIVRLAQLSRAAGIHLILATQRPSVDVVTGLIKANFPSRIAFQVSSRHDSRTILDTVGAEHLLGQGDMLYKPSAGKITRIHGALAADEDINGVIAFWKAKQQAPSFEMDFLQWKQDSERSAAAESNGSDVLDDPKYAEAVDFVQDQGRASISMIQRRLRIGFNRAARFIEQMERDGVIGPQEGSKPRTVLK